MDRANAGTLIVVAIKDDSSFNWFSAVVASEWDKTTFSALVGSTQGFQGTSDMSNLYRIPR